MTNANEKKYFVKHEWIFNLEAMQDKLWCIGNDIDEGTIATPITLLGKVINDSCDVNALMEEAGNLEYVAKRGKVTGKQYGRIKEMVEWRVNQRYMRCMANGMDEREAGLCFSDM